VEGKGGGRKGRGRGREGEWEGRGEEERGGEGTNLPSLNPGSAAGPTTEVRRCWTKLKLLPTPLNKLCQDCVKYGMRWCSIHVKGQISQS